MSIIFNSISIPDEFSRLLRANMQAGGKYESSLSSIFNRSPHLKYIVKSTFNLDTSKSDLWSLIKNLGWIGLRNRLASVYLSYIQNGVYPKEYDLSLIKKIEEFETRLKEYQVDGHSRIFLLGMFLKSQEFADDKEWLTLFSDKKFLACLELTSAKVLKLDWLLLMMFQFKLFLGIEDLINRLSEKNSFEQLYLALSPEEQRIYLGNLLTYGHSIGELESFFYETV